jgi:Uma2 family endonuclease
MSVALKLEVSENPEIIKLLRPQPLEDGSEPEERLIVCGLNWERYLALDEAFGDDRPDPRLYYLDGNLEVRTTSREHERIKKWIAGLLEIYFEHIEVEVTPTGQATLRDPIEQAGAEPDDSWCIGPEKQIPDLVLEIALTSGGVRKLDVYAKLLVSEVWFWKAGRLEIHTLLPSREYKLIEQSKLLPALPSTHLERCVAIRSWSEARKAFRAAFARNSG